MPIATPDRLDERDRRRAAGIYYTPGPVAEYLARRALEAIEPRADRPPRILDPACGDGAFLRAALHALLSEDGGNHVARHVSGISLPPAARVVGSQLFGIDQDSQAVERARRELLREARCRDGHWPGDAEKFVRRSLRRHLRIGDALFDLAPPPSAEGEIAPAPTLTESYDVVLANPPFINIRRLARSTSAETRQRLRQRFRCASRAYDLYVLFIELAFELLRDEGICGLIVPNKIGSADYAAPCRQLLLRQTEIVEIIDASDARIFRQAGVYPYLMLWRKRPPAARHRVRVGQLPSPGSSPPWQPSGDRACSAGEPPQTGILPPLVVGEMPQAGWHADTGFGLSNTWEVERRVATRPLGEMAHLESGTTGFAAGRLADQLIERDEARAAGHRPEDWFEFIVSGSIDRYAVRRQAVRFMKRRFQQPVLLREATSLSDRKRELFAGPKIVLAGMVRRLEAALDPGGLALGVQVYAAVPRDEPPLYLLALLNSKLLSFLFRRRFPAKRLGGGYLALNKGQLERLPIRALRPENAEDQRWRRALLERAGELQRLRTEVNSGRSATPPSDARLQEAERAVDEIVYALYGLRERQIDEVERETVPE